MRRESLLFTVAALITILLWGCGKKFPMPPEPGEGIPPESSYVQTDLPWGVDGAVDILRGSDGRIYVLYPDRIEKRYSNGGLITSFGELNGARALTEGPNRTLYVVDSEKVLIKVYTFEGASLGNVELSEPINSTGIAYGEGKVFITSNALDLLLKFDTLGMLLDTLAQRGNGILNVKEPVGVYYDALGRVLVASTGHNWVEAFTTTKPVENLLHLGGTSPEGGSGEGEFKSPLDVAVNEEGYVFVADSGNMRVQKFSPEGDFIVEIPVEGYPLRLDVEPDGNTFFVLVLSDGSEKILKFRKTPKPGGGE